MDILDRPKGLIKDFIYVKDNSLSKSFCDEVIKKFDKDPRQKDGIIGKDTNQRVDKSIKDTKDIHISSTEGWEKEDTIFFESLKLGLEEYIEYLTNLNDWSMSSEPVASRIFTFMWYLNTIEEKDEGYTEFADGTKIQPVAGRLIFFPATWTFLHRGYPPKVKKYLCNGWIHSSP